MQFSLEQLEAFISTIEEGSFSAAARRLGKAQSSISGLITNLEIDAGFELFDRSSRSPVLTENGKILLRETKAVLKTHHHLKMKIDSLNKKVDNQITLAFDELAFPRDLLTNILITFQVKFPATSLLILNCSHHEAYKLVQTGKADLGITLSIDDYPEGLYFKGFTTAKYHTVVAKNHPLERLTKVTTDDLANYYHIRISDADSGFRSYDSDISTNIWYVNSAVMMLELVKNNLGWAQLPVHIFSSEQTVINLSAENQTIPFIQNVDMIWRHESALGVAGDWLVEMLTNTGKKLASQF
jgi:DNA-binding transcriptional LysR family regulator